MTFLKNYIACVKANGKILREDAEGRVFIPWGSEFSLLLKNLNSVRATVKVSVDGQDATEGTSLIIPANGSAELERYIRNGNLSNGNKFKFIERTAKIEEHKGIGSEDGLIRVEYRAETVPEIKRTVVEHVHHHDYYGYPYWGYPLPYYQPYERVYLGGAAVGSTINTSVTYGGGAERSMQSNVSTPTIGALTKCLNNVGITVPGSESAQKFTQGSWFKTETASHVIVLQLRGELSGKPVKQAVTVKSKKKCDTCGKVNKALDKFCGDCGTSLTII